MRVVARGYSWKFQRWTDGVRRLTVERPAMVGPPQALLLQALLPQVGLPHLGHHPRDLHAERGLLRKQLPSSRRTQ